MFEGATPQCFCDATPAEEDIQRAYAFIGVPLASSLAREEIDALHPLNTVADDIDRESRRYKEKIAAPARTEDEQLPLSPKEHRGLLLPSEPISSDDQASVSQTVLKE